MFSKNYERLCFQMFQRILFGMYAQCTVHLICWIIKTISNLNLLHNSSSTNVSICLCQLESFVFSIQCFTFSYYHLLLSFLTFWLHSFLPISFHYSNELMVCLNAVLVLINVYPTRIVSKIYKLDTTESN